MRIYANLDEMHSETNRNLHSLGIIVHPQTMQDKNVASDPAYETLELSPHEFTILDGSDRDRWLVEHGGSLEWCRHDFEERVWTPFWNGRPGPNPGEAHKLRPEWAEFIHDGRFAYTYGERIGRAVWVSDGIMPTAIQAVVAQLRTNPDTRQAILPIFNGDLDLPNLGGKKRVPCSLHYQFLIREDELRLHYAMRSSDFHTHFLYDIWHALELQSFVAQRLGRSVGRFVFSTASLHLYRKDADGGVF